MTYRELFRLICQQKLPPHEANILLEKLGGLSKTALMMHFDDECSPPIAKQIQKLTSLRKTGQPLQYLLGEWEFFGLDFFVGDGVLIPRADTEILVETSLELLEGRPAPAVCDLCSGSGCIPIALAQNLPREASLTAVELSDKALSYLIKNKERHHCSNLKVICDDVLTFCSEDKFDLITSNPPYISAEEMEQVQKELLFEPRMALEAEENGLLFYRVISSRYGEYLKPGGYLAFEIGCQQGEAVSRLLCENGFTNVCVIQDYGGNDRVVTGQWNQ